MKQADWFIERKRIDYKQFLDTALKNNNHSAAANEPINRQYELLKTYLQKYYTIEQKGGWASVSDENNKLKKGDSAIAISKIKKQLLLMEDLTVNDTTRVFNQTLEDGLKKFQNRNGIKEDGMLNNPTLRALQVSPATFIQKILINMERSRWVPAQMKGDYLAVNIPEFKLHVYTNDKLNWSCNVVVGKSKRVSNTVIFNDLLDRVVFSPYWNIPNGILTKEIIPSIQKNISYLERHNLEVVDGEKLVAAASINWDKYTGNNFPYTVRQKPGKKNSLGLVKFLFPNQYDIYLHDTPEKPLFEEGTRAFSHGCVRVEQPLKLATFLLRYDASWT
jgi:murein L,D-transpeptidase YcbB/YkuD